jgi:ribosomal protein S18 acetylase RimI-like enzyme
MPERQPPRPPAIRPASTNDVARIAQIVERAYSKYVPRIGRRPGPMDDDYSERVRQRQAFVAEADGIVGVIVLIDHADHLFVDNVAVDPDHQQRGIGRALLEHAESRAAALGLPELRLYTNEAMTENIRMYPRLGFEETGRQEHHGFHRVLFRKRLA